MWLLSCSGDLLDHKTLWLRPGFGHLLGRTSGRAPDNETVRFINHKSVSRKHVLIHVSPIKPGSSARLHEHTELTITDSSKSGTYVDGEKLCQTSKTLKGNGGGGNQEWVVKLGSYEQVLKLEWREVVCTFTNLSKKDKAGGDPVSAQREKLEALDVKVTSDYVVNRTSHVVGKKRNTPAGLQALLQGKWVVMDGFVNALVKAAARGEADAEGETRPSALEEDFDGHWPREEDYILPAGQEPNPRPNELLKPNAGRAELFSGFVFVFLSQHQFDLLMPVVTSGGGKAFLWEVELGKSSEDDLVAYVQELAGKKGNQELRLSQHVVKGGIVIVRLGDKDDPWVKNFLTSLEIRLEQRSAEQNQFLDAILMCNTSELRKPLRHATPNQSQDVNVQAKASHDSTSHLRENGHTRATPREPDQPQVQQPTPSSERPMAPPPARQKTRRILTKPKFAGFDDFEPEDFARPVTKSPEPDPSQAVSVQSMEVDEPSQPADTQNQRSSRKRPAPSEEPQENERDMMDAMLTGRAAYKRQKSEQPPARNGETGSARATPDRDTSVTKRAPKKKESKKMDVQAELKARAKAEEEKRLQDEESLRNAMDGLDVKSVKPIIETYELAPRQPLARQIDTQTSDGVDDRWDPAWNGRRNFKRFRRQGTRNDGPRLQRVIVPLEEVPRKDRGLGDEYWLESSSSTSRNKKKSQSQSQAQSLSQAPRGTAGVGGEEDDPTRFRRRLQNSRREDVEAAEEEEPWRDDIGGGGRGKPPRGTAATSQTVGRSQKRVAPDSSGGPAAKRPRQVVEIVDEEEDALKFRRRRRA